MNHLSRNYTSIADRTHAVKAGKSARARRNWAWDGRHDKKAGKVRRVDPATYVPAWQTRYTITTKTGA